MSWTIGPDKYLREDEIQILFKRTEDLATIDKSRGRQSWQKVWMLIDLLFHTGCRVNEVRHIQHQNIILNGQEPRLFVSHGKCGKQRWIPLGSVRLKSHLKEYYAFKQMINQGTGDEDYLFQSKKCSQYSVMGLQNMFYKALNAAGIKNHSIHSARHSFATIHYQRNRDLRALQLLLGHSSPQTTCVYADRPFSQLVESTENLYSQGE